MGQFPFLFRSLCVLLSSLLFLTNAVFAYTPESNFWKERREVRHSRESGNPVFKPSFKEMSTTWIPAFAGMTNIPLSHINGSIRNILPPARQKKGPTVLHIQDVHMNQEAQTNIGNTIQHLIRQNKVGLIALEGAFGPIDLSRFQKFPHQDTVHKMADTLLEEKKIGGPIYAALTAGTTMANIAPTVLGVDDPHHHRANVEAYRRAAHLVEKNKQKLEKWRADLKERKLSVFSHQLSVFDETVEEYGEGKMSLGDYVQQIFNFKFLISNQFSIHHIQNFLKALSLESSLNFLQVEQERTQLLHHLSTKLGNQTARQPGNPLLDLSRSYRLGNISRTEFYRSLEDLCRSNGIDLKRYPALSKYRNYIFLSDQIEAEQLFAEMRELEQVVYASLAETEEEKVLVKESRQLYLVGKLLDFALTKSEWGECKKLSVVSRQFSVKSFEDFYEEAENRDKAMAANLLTQVLTTDNCKLKTTILVTGGFHSSGIDQKLAKAGCTVINFVPKISHVDTENGPAYLSVFAQEKTPLETLFEGDKLFLAPLTWSPGQILESSLLVAADEVLRTNGGPDPKEISNQLINTPQKPVIAALKIFGLVFFVVWRAGVGVVLIVAKRTNKFARIAVQVPLATLNFGKNHIPHLLADFYEFLKFLEWLIQPKLSLAGFPFPAHIPLFFQQPLDTPDAPAAGPINSTTAHLSAQQAAVLRKYGGSSIQDVDRVTAENLLREGRIEGRVKIVYRKMVAVADKEIAGQLEVALNHHNQLLSNALGPSRPSDFPDQINSSSERISRLLNDVQVLAGLPSIPIDPTPADPRVSIEIATLLTETTKTLSSWELNLNLEPAQSLISILGPPNFSSPSSTAWASCKGKTFIFQRSESGQLDFGGFQISIPESQGNVFKCSLSPSSSDQPDLFTLSISPVGVHQGSITELTLNAQHLQKEIPLVQQFQTAMETYFELEKEAGDKVSRRDQITDQILNLLFPDHPHLPLATFPTAVPTLLTQIAALNYDVPIGTWGFSELISLMKIVSDKRGYQANLAIKQLKGQVFLGRSDAKGVIVPGVSMSERPNQLFLLKIIEDKTNEWELTVQALGSLEKILLWHLLNPRRKSIDKEDGSQFDLPDPQVFKGKKYYSKYEILNGLRLDRVKGIRINRYWWDRLVRNGIILVEPGKGVPATMAQLMRDEARKLTQEHYTPSQLAQFLADIHGTSEEQELKHLKETLLLKYHSKNEVYRHFKPKNHPDNFGRIDVLYLLIEQRRMQALATLVPVQEHLKENGFKTHSAFVLGFKERNATSFGTLWVIGLGSRGVEVYVNGAASKSNQLLIIPLLYKWAAWQWPEKYAGEEGYQRYATGLGPVLEGILFQFLAVLIFGPQFFWIGVVFLVSHYVLAQTSERRKPTLSPTLDDAPFRLFNFIWRVGGTILFYLPLVGVFHYAPFQSLNSVSLYFFSLGFLLHVLLGALLGLWAHKGFNKRSLILGFSPLGPDQPTSPINRDGMTPLEYWRALQTADEEASNKLKLAIAVRSEEDGLLQILENIRPLLDLPPPRESYISTNPAGEEEEHKFKLFPLTKQILAQIGLGEKFISFPELDKRIREAKPAARDKNWGLTPVLGVPALAQVPAEGVIELPWGRHRFPELAGKLVSITLEKKGRLVFSFQIRPLADGAQPAQEVLVNIATLNKALQTAQTLDQELTTYLTQTHRKSPAPTNAKQLVDFFDSAYKDLAQDEELLKQLNAAISNLQAQQEYKFDHWALELKALLENILKRECLFLYEKETEKFKLKENLTTLRQVVGTHLSDRFHSTQQHEIKQLTESIGGFFMEDPDRFIAQKSGLPPLLLDVLKKHKIPRNLLSFNKFKEIYSHAKKNKNMSLLEDGVFLAASNSDGIIAWEGERIAVPGHPKELFLLELIPRQGTKTNTDVRRLKISPLHQPEVSLTPYCWDGKNKKFVVDEEEEQIKSANLSASDLPSPKDFQGQHPKGFSPTDLIKRLKFHEFLGGPAVVKKLIANGIIPLEKGRVPTPIALLLAKQASELGWTHYTLVEAAQLLAAAEESNTSKTLPVLKQFKNSPTGAQGYLTNSPKRSDLIHRLDLFYLMVETERMKVLKKRLAPLRTHLSASGRSIAEKAVSKFRKENKKGVGTLWLKGRLPGIPTPNYFYIMPENKSQPPTTTQGGGGGKRKGRELTQSLEEQGMIGGHPSGHYYPGDPFFAGGGSQDPLQKSGQDSHRLIIKERKEKIVDLLGEWPALQDFVFDNLTLEPYTVRDEIEADPIWHIQISWSDQFLPERYQDHPEDDEELAFSGADKVDEDDWWRGKLHQPTHPESLRHEINANAIWDRQVFSGDPKTIEDRVHSHILLVFFYLYVMWELDPLWERVQPSYLSQFDDDWDRGMVLKTYVRYKTFRRLFELRRDLQLSAKENFRIALSFISTLTMMQPRWPQVKDCLSKVLDFEAIGQLESDVKAIGNRPFKPVIESALSMFMAPTHSPRMTREKIISAQEHQYLPLNYAVGQMLRGNPSVGWSNTLGLGFLFLPQISEISLISFFVISLLGGWLIWKFLVDQKRRRQLPQPVTTRSGASSPTQSMAVFSKTGPAMTPRVPAMTVEQRQEIWSEAGGTPYRIPSDQIDFNLTTDDSNYKLTEEQRQAMRSAKSAQEELRKLKATCQRLFPGFSFFRPLARGSEGEAVLAKMLLKPGMVVSGLLHFEPGALHVEAQGASSPSTDHHYGAAPLNNPNEKFAGNPDLEHMKQEIETNPSNVGYILIMLTNNEAAGQPVSPERLREINKLARKHRIPIFLDIARIWDNAQLIKERLPTRYGHRTIQSIVNELLHGVDGFVLSAKKNVTGVGGLIGFRDHATLERLLAKTKDEWNKREVLATLFPASPPLSAPDLAVTRVGLERAASDQENSYQSYLCQHLWNKLNEAGVPVTPHRGGHGVTIKVDEFFSEQLKEARAKGQGDLVNPAVTLNALLYWVGSLTGNDFGVAGVDKNHLFRLALGRGRWTEVDIDAIADIIIYVYQQREDVTELSQLSNGPYLEKHGLKPLFHGENSELKIIRHSRMSLSGIQIGSPLTTPDKNTRGQARGDDDLGVSPAPFGTPAFAKLEEAVQNLFGMGRNFVFGSPNRLTTRSALKQWAQNRFKKGFGQMWHVVDKPTKNFPAIRESARKHRIPIILNFTRLDPDYLASMMPLVPYATVIVSHAFQHTPAGFFGFVQEVEPAFLAASDLILGYWRKQNVSEGSLHQIAQQLAAAKSNKLEERRNLIADAKEKLSEANELLATDEVSRFFGRIQWDSQEWGSVSMRDHLKSRFSYSKAHLYDNSSTEKLTEIYIELTTLYQKLQEVLDHHFGNGASNGSLMPMPVRTVNLYFNETLQFLKSAIQVESFEERLWWVARDLRDDGVTAPQFLEGITSQRAGTVYEKMDVVFKRYGVLEDERENAFARLMQIMNDLGDPRAKFVELSQKSLSSTTTQLQSPSVELIPPLLFPPIQRLGVESLDGRTLRRLRQST